MTNELDDIAEVTDSECKMRFSLGFLFGFIAAAGALVAVWAGYHEGRLPHTPWETFILSVGLVVAASWFFVNAVPQNDASLVTHLLVGLIVGASTHILVVSLIAHSGPIFALFMVEDDWGRWIPYGDAFADGFVFRILAGVATGLLLGIFRRPSGERV